MNRHYFKTSEQNFAEFSILKKIFYVLIQLPFEILQSLTIPNLEAEHWNQRLLTVMPWASCFFVIIATNNIVTFFTNWIMMAIVFPVLLLTSFIIYKTTYRNKMPENLILLCIYCFAMSIFWIYVISNVIIDLINIFGAMFQINSSVLALTVLALGISVPDLVLNTSLAMQGFGVMAISGSFAGPLFNILFGMGLSLIKSSYNSPDGTFKFNILSNKLIVYTLAILLLNFFNLLINGKLNKFNLKRYMAIIGIAVYALYVLGALYIVLSES